MSSRNLRIIAAVAIAIVVITVAGVYWVLFQIQDPDLSEIYLRALDESLILNEDSETVVQGRVSHTGMGCGSGQENCHLVLQYGGWPINVYYLSSPEGETCANEEAAQHAEEINNGDEVEVFARYYADGSLSTCDSTDYYIRQLATGD